MGTCRWALSWEQMLQTTSFLGVTCFKMHWNWCFVVVARGGSMMKKSQFEIQAAAEPRTADDGSPSCSVMSHSDVVVWKTDGSTRVLHPVFNNTDKTTLGPKGPWTWRANFMFETNWRTSGQKLSAAFSSSKAVIFRGVSHGRRFCAASGTEGRHE